MTSTRNLVAKILKPFKAWIIQSNRVQNKKPASSQNQKAKPSLKGAHDYGSELASLARHFHGGLSW